jgi:hypothetical protein
MLPTAFSVILYPFCLDVITDTVGTFYRRYRNYLLGHILNYLAKLIKNRYDDYSVRNLMPFSPVSYQRFRGNSALSEVYTNHIEEARMTQSLKRSYRFRKPFHLISEKVFGFCCVNELRAVRQHPCVDRLYGVQASLAPIHLHLVIDGSDSGHHC